ncbi:hypothetical protein QTP70_033731 [Hemibagrus guttatus]|uniref:Lupus La protein n=1 Tax=Hemibagrus guttatus TaxID=175788 RepID=A0AAE0RK76_9TELE|nr:hypothetical protein QTP70_033731 [Hemibagrus guttatus]
MDGINEDMNLVGAKMKKKTLMVFDFDHTLVDQNSDTWVIQCAPEQSLPAWLENSYQRGRWTEYMGRVFSYIGEQSVSPDAVRELMQTIPFTDGMIELLKFIYQNKSHIDCIIVSDSNTLFIDWILEAGGVASAVDRVFSNPASVDQRGYIEVRCFHSHTCERCPVNMCKQKVLSDFRARQADDGVNYHTVCYVGDGTNDFCPIKALNEGDIAMPRKGFSLEKLLAKSRSERMAEEQEMSPLEKKVAEQIEYYFGDHNLPRDKFLKEQIQLDDGWVTLETMLKFNRLKNLTSDPAVIVESLRKSKTGLLEVSEDQTKIRRNLSKPLPEYTEEYKDALKHKSIYMKGFPLDTTLDDIKDWLADKGHVENIQMRKGPQKTFKGSIFAVLESDEAAKAFVARDDVKQFKGNDMIVLIKDEYFAKKAEERKQGRADAKAKAKSEKEEKQKQAEKEEMKSLEEQRGCVLKFSGELDHVSREDFHKIFAEHAQIKWIDFTRGAKEGTILFRSDAKEALQKAQEAAGGSELKIKDKDVKWEVLEGEGELEVLKKILESQQESLNKRKGGRGGHRGRGRGRGGRRDRGGREHTQFQGKKTKFDSDEEEGDDGEDAEPAVKKRALESNGTDADTPASKKAKEEEENGS